ncbi:MAG TPA: AgmX/PglI C-terminal domain-containing protein [Polyangia bacterium]|nr:AgmX/PglI C-terminal domain-containing protein [Polyangia bacterium]
MQRELRLDRTSGPPPPPPFADPGAVGSPLAAPAAATIALAAPALVVVARFRDLALATRVLRAGRPGRFTVGPGRGADAPVNPAWLGATTEGAPAHPLVEQAAGAFRVNLGGPMRAQLWTAHQRLPLAPDAGRPEAPLVLPPDAHVRIPCGEVSFEIRSTEAPLPLPRPILPSGWRRGLRYPAAVALGLAALLGLAHLIPSDPRALSLDMWGADRRLDRMVTIPLDVAAPVVDRMLHATAAGASSGRAAAGPSGQAGSRQAPRRDARMAVASPTKAADARAAAALVRRHGLLALLDGQPASALADVLATGPAMGPDARDVLGNLQGATIAEAYGAGNLGRLGSGAGDAGTGEGTLGTGTLATLGRFGSGPGGDSRYGAEVGKLARRPPHVPDPTIGQASVRGALDKEIIRRIVRRHVNEVRYCYDQALAAHPSLAGRVVVQFTIAPTGRVLASLVQSTTLGSPAVEACVVGAVRRWEFPQPEGGGLVSVSYPFLLSPAGQ